MLAQTFGYRLRFVPRRGERRLSAAHTGWQANLRAAKYPGKPGHGIVTPPPLGLDRENPHPVRP